MRVARGSSDAAAVATRGSERRGKKLSLDGTKDAGATPVCARAMTHQRGLEGVDVVLAHDAVDVDGVQEPPVEPRAPSLEAELRRRRSALGARHAPAVHRAAPGENRGVRHVRGRAAVHAARDPFASPPVHARRPRRASRRERRCARGARRRDAEGAKHKTEGKAGTPGGRETAISSKLFNDAKWCT